jgi:hypothetical protein
MSRGVIIFWLLAVGCIALDLLHSPYGYRVEPPALALASGETASGGHCSDR